MTKSYGVANFMIYFRFQALKMGKRLFSDEKTLTIHKIQTRTFLVLLVSHRKCLSKNKFSDTGSALKFKIHNCFKK